MYPNREIYSRPPVAMVTAQAMFTDSPRLHQPENLEAFAAALQHRLPQAEQVASMAMQEAGPGLQPQMVPQVGLVLRNPDATESITLTSWSVTFETTTYRDFETFRSGLVEACETLVSLNIRPAMRRIGLRYINEIRVPEPVNNVRDWSTWVNSDLLGSLRMTDDETPVRAVQGAVAYDLGNGGGLNVGYAALLQGTVVTPQFLVRPPIPPGPCFVVDVDGYYEFAEAALPLNSEVVDDLQTTVHGPIGSAFQRAITDNARSVFRGDGSVS